MKNSHQLVFSETSGDVDAIFYLQAYAEGWTDGNFEMKYDVRPCLADMDKIYRQREGKWFVGKDLNDAI